MGRRGWRWREAPDRGAQRGGVVVAPCRLPYDGARYDVTTEMRMWGRRSWSSTTIIIIIIGDELPNETCDLAQLVWLPAGGRSAAFRDLVSLMRHC